MLDLIRKFRKHAMVAVMQRMVYFFSFDISVYIFISHTNTAIELSVLVIRRDGTTSSHPEQRS